MGCRELLQSPNTYSGNLDDPAALLKQINKVAKIDRLPTTTSPEALKTLRAAWDGESECCYRTCPRP